MKISTIQNKSGRIIRKLAAALLWFLIWQAIYMIVKQEILIVSPLQVVENLGKLVGQESFWAASSFSLIRIVLGLVIAIALGTMLAILTSFVPIAHDFFHPAISTIKATPVASFIILALVWIKTDNVSVFTAFLMVLPVIWGNVSEGIKNTDPKLLEMARTYRFSRTKILKRIYLPSVMPYFIAACTTSMGLAWKAGIAAEVIASPKFSIGGHLHDAKVYLETADLFAWTAVVILLSVVLEKIFVMLIQAAGKKYSMLSVEPQIIKGR